jgi:hypothetical protein
VRRNVSFVLAQRIVVVIGAAVALGALGRYLDSLDRPDEFGWFAYAPLNSSINVPWEPERPWVHLAIWLGVIVVWTLASLWVITTVLARRILLVIGLAGALGALGQYLMTLRHENRAGLQFLSSEQRVAGLPLAPWVQLLIWLGLAAVWALVSLKLLRPRATATAPTPVADRDPQEY